MVIIITAIAREIIINLQNVGLNAVDINDRTCIDY